MTYAMVFNFWDYLFFGYTLVVMISYLTLAIISIVALRGYLRHNDATDYTDILNSPLAPSVSLIAPAYNEEKTIVNNIRSLLSLTYTNYEVIIVNDGSKDDTLVVALEAYQMEPVNFEVNHILPTESVRAVYKSRNPLYRHLVVVDKENGGKADALNAGINLSGNDYIMCVDVDCVLSEDALLKLMKPFLEEDQRKVIAAGGVLRISNSCQVEMGHLVDTHVPRNWLSRFQTLEYLRAFLLARVAWSHLDGLILVSGALGVFDKSLVIKVGGYSRETVGEDMDLVIRLRRYMHELKLPYRVAFIPDPLCWTETPETPKVLQQQRNRWTRGTIEVLRTHRKMFFNPRYGRMGLISYPYWLLMEWLAPLLETFGLILALVLGVQGLIHWPFFLLMLALIWFFSLCMTALTLFGEEITFRKYRRLSEVFRLLITGLLEPFFFHPFLVYSAVRGNIDYLLGRNDWGDMIRLGFQTPDALAKEIHIVKNKDTQQFNENDYPLS